MDSGVVKEKKYVYADPDVVLNPRIRRIGVILPVESEFGPEDLRKEAVRLAKEGKCRVIIEWREKFQPVVH